MIARGFSPTPNAVLQRVSLSVEARLLYAIILGLRWESVDGRTPATLPQLAECSGLSRSTVARRIKELGREGLLEWTRGGRGRPNRYLPLEIVPRSRPTLRGAGLLPGEASGIEAPTRGADRELAVAAQEAPELEDGSGVRDAEDARSARVGAPRASRGAADANGSGAGARVRIAHDTERTGRSGGRSTAQQRQHHSPEHRDGGRLWQTPLDADNAQKSAQPGLCAHEQAAVSGARARAAA